MTKTVTQKPTVLHILLIQDLVFFVVQDDFEKLLIPLKPFWDNDFRAFDLPVSVSGFAAWPFTIRINDHRPLFEPHKLYLPLLFLALCLRIQSLEYSFRFFLDLYGNYLHTPSGGELLFNHC